MKERQRERSWKEELCKASFSGNTSSFGEEEEEEELEKISPPKDPIFLQNRDTYIKACSIGTFLIT